MKYIIVLGIQNSGSGAIHDYLASRGDCEAPFGPNEFRLCNDPTGLHNLYLNFYNNYSFQSSSNASFDFLNYTKRIQNFIVYPSRGIKKRLYNKNFYNLSKKFIEKVSKLKFYGRPEFSNFKISKFENFLLKFKKNRYSFFPIIIPVKKEKFLLEAKKYINKIIENNLKKKLNKNSKIILNQTINIFDPVESSKYFQNKKIIYVTRDPRDMFSSMKYNKASAAPWMNIDYFIQWYKYYFDNLEFKKRLKNNNILHVKFEDFVTNFTKENYRICKFLNINSDFKLKKVNCFFDLSVSKKNLTKYENYLSKNENDKIKNNLKKFLQR